MSGSLPLMGRVAFVAGAGSRLGRPIAVALAEAGADLALASTTRETTEEFAINSVANELWALERRHVAVTMDYAEPPSVAEAVRRALAELGRLDLLVNAAEPVSDAAPFAAMASADWEQLVRYRLDGAALVCRAAGQAMIEQGSGAILTLVSAAARGRAGHAALAAGDAGILGLTRSLALEWAGQVAVNAAVIRDETPPAPVAALAVLLAGAAALSGQVFEL